MSRGIPADRNNILENQSSRNRSLGPRLIGRRLSRTRRLQRNQVYLMVYRIETINRNYIHPRTNLQGKKLVRTFQKSVWTTVQLR